MEAFYSERSVLLFLCIVKYVFCNVFFFFFFENLLQKSILLSPQCVAKNDLHNLHTCQALN